MFTRSSVTAALWLCRWAVVDKAYRKKEGLELGMWEHVCGGGNSGSKLKIEPRLLPGSRFWLSLYGVDREMVESFIPAVPVHWSTDEKWGFCIFVSLTGDLDEAGEIKVCIKGSRKSSVMLGSYIRISFPSTECLGFSIGNISKSHKCLLPYVKMRKSRMGVSHWRYLQSWISYITVGEDFIPRIMRTLKLVPAISRRFTFRLFQNVVRIILVSRHIPICRSSQSICSCVLVEFGSTMIPQSEIETVWSSPNLLVLFNHRK